MAVKIAAKFIVIALLVATAHGSGGFSSFSYGVSDPNTGDIKDQHEKREGGNVVGKYSLLESDGTKRVVEYSASDATGFNAVVHKEPAGVAPGAINALGHAGLAHGGLANGALAHGGSGIAAPGVHPAPITAAGPLAHAAPFAAAGHLTHGAHNAVSYANSNLANPALTHGAHGSLGYGYGSPLAGGLTGNLAGLAGSAAPAVSHYAQSIAHEVRPYSGPYASAYGGYGAHGSYSAQAPSAHGANLGLLAGLAGRNTLAHGAHNALSYANSNLENPALTHGAHGSLGYGYGSPLAGGLAGNLAGLAGYATLAHGAHNALSYANSNLANPALTHGAHGSLGYGYGSPLAGGLAGNPAGLTGSATPAVSHYAQSIVHEVRPYSGPYASAHGGYGAYGSYGAQAGLAHGANLGLGGLAHGSLSSPHGALASPLTNRGFAHGGWTSPVSQGALASPLAHGSLAPQAYGGFRSPLSHGALNPSLGHGAHGINSGRTW